MTSFETPRCPTCNRELWWDGTRSRRWVCGPTNTLAGTFHDGQSVFDASDKRIWPNQTNQQKEHHA